MFSSHLTLHDSPFSHNCYVIRETSLVIWMWQWINWDKIGLYYFILNVYSGIIRLCHKCFPIWFSLFSKWRVLAHRWQLSETDKAIRCVHSALCLLWDLFESTYLFIRCCECMLWVQWITLWPVIKGLHLTLNHLLLVHITLSLLSFLSIWPFCKFHIILKHFLILFFMVYMWH